MLLFDVGAAASTGDRPRFPTYSSRKKANFEHLYSHLLPQASPSFQVVISTKFIEKIACRPRNSLTCSTRAKIACSTFHLSSFILSSTRLHNLLWQGAENDGRKKKLLVSKSNLFGLFTYLTKTHWEERWGQQPKFSRPNSSAFLSADHTKFF